MPAIPAREVPRIQRALVRFAVFQEEVAEILRRRGEFVMSVPARAALRQSLKDAMKVKF